MVQGEENVKAEFVGFFKDQLGFKDGPPPINTDVIKGTIRNRLSDHMVSDMEREFSEAEIKEALFSLKDNKILAQMSLVLVTSRRPGRLWEVLSSRPLIISLVLVAARGSLMQQLLLWCQRLPTQLRSQI